jgi:RNA polymerase sigma factor (TIGR02999 family)
MDVTNAPQNKPDDVTRVLRRAAAGDHHATNELFPLVYEELRQIAARFLGSERAGHTLQPTALVNEAYLRLIGPNESGWESRAHFFGAAAQAIRRILVDHARTKHAAKRGGHLERESVALESIAGEVENVDMVALDEAMERLAKFDAQKAKVVELRFFGGLTGEETATALGISASTVARDWQFARVWLKRELEGQGGG